MTSPGRPYIHRTVTRPDAWRCAIQLFIAQLTLWRARRRERQTLAGMDDAQLRDIGRTRADALQESAKPFWQP